MNSKIKKNAFFYQINSTVQEMSIRIILRNNLAFWKSTKAIFLNRINARQDAFRFIPNWTTVEKGQAVNLRFLAKHFIVLKIAVVERGHSTNKEVSTAYGWS